MTLITGGARSGKSAFAEALANSDGAGGQVLYIATMEEIVEDKEALERIRRHRERRPQSWSTVEVPFNLDQTVLKIPKDTDVCLIDCLSLYVSNMLLALDEKSTTAKELEDPIQEAASKLLSAMHSRPEIRFIVVTNEVGWGIVPEHKLARSYRDLLGLVNQQFAQAAGEVWLSCVGLQVKLKPTNY
ncbi:MAG: bifunctional adenosylcobinamide kinase/adenosylcobinamide-phosphate guanylyltransferase [Candidatus Melainabacteria bacterium]|nr:bifunctional adenosylcobinamide kinase/adenosylcobinamide-phosphate guanylyltransferase [Candidatus Melainabacteria bacterium]